MKPWDMSIVIRSHATGGDKPPLTNLELLEVAEYLDCLSRIHVEMKGYGEFEPFEDYLDACQNIEKHLTAAGLEPEPRDEE